MRSKRSVNERGQKCLRWSSLLLVLSACSSAAPGTEHQGAAGGSANSGGVAGQTIDNDAGLPEAGAGGIEGAAGSEATGGTGGTGGTGDTPGPIVEFGLDARPNNTSCIAGNAPPTNYRLAPIWGSINFGTALGVVPSPDGDTLYVLEKRGVARAVPKGLSVSAAEVHDFLDLTPLINTDAESGLLNMAFHPNFTQNGYVYVTYTRNDGNHSTRIARFQTLDDGNTLDLGTEAVVLEVTQVRGTHHGGGLAFGADGYLYASFGDNNTGDDHADWTAQNRMSLYGSVVRLDVNVPGAGYNIPADNPYADGVAGAPEVFAKGFRNPWRFSFDRLTHDLWLADPGEEANGQPGDNGIADPYEEVDRVSLGGYYGWPFWQGTHCYHDCQQEQGTGPEFEYSHNGGPSAIIGGFVYRGSALPGLYGKYVFGDYETGEAWALDTSSGDRQSLGFGGKLVSFGQDNDGEIYALREGGAVEMLQDSNAGTGGFPELLTNTGCVDPSNPTHAVEGMIPFSVAVPFWSDGVQKERYLALPEGTTLEVAADGDFTLPIGGVTMKNFKWQDKYFETRFFVRHNDGSYYGYSYEWNAEQTEATLVSGEGKRVSLPGLEWSYPTTAQCFTCHSEAAGRSLGLETRQLNSLGKYGAVRANQLDTLNHIGVLSGNTMPLDPFAAMDDATASIELRAKSYLAVNCSNCHRPGGPGRGEFNALFDTPFADMGICNQAPEHGDLGMIGAPLLTPGDHQSSVLWLRMSQREANFMPPIASQLADAKGAELLSEWIDSLAACP